MQDAARTFNVQFSAQFSEMIEKSKASIRPIIEAQENLKESIRPLIESKIIWIG